MGRGVVGGPAVVGALRVLRVPLEVGRAEQRLHRVSRFVLPEELRLAHAGAAAELVALVLGRGAGVVPVAGHVLDGVLWAVCHPWSNPQKWSTTGSWQRERDRAGGAADVGPGRGQLRGLPAAPACSTELFFRDARRESRP